jgi:predicted metal-dependent hydrolase
MINVTPRRITVKLLRRRWGSTTKDGVLNFNANLMKASVEAIEYIVLHELCHLKISNHSQKFWQLMESAMPNYKDRAKCLDTKFIDIIE